MNITNETLTNTRTEISFYTQLIVDALGIVSQFACAGFFLYNSRAGLGSGHAPFNNLMPRSRDMSDIGSYACLICGTYYWLSFTVHFNNQVTMYDLLLWRYVSYIGTCPFLLLDFYYQVGLHFSLFTFVLITLCLILGRIAESAPDQSTQLSLFLLASVFMLTIFAQFGAEIRTIWPTIHKDARWWLMLAWYTFSSTWTVFPAVFVARYFVTLSHEADIIVRLILDFMAKGLYTYWIMRFRHVMEDMELDDTMTLSDASNHASIGSNERPTPVRSYRMRIAQESSSESKRKLPSFDGAFFM